MSFARKMRRKGLNKTSCCGKQMLRKELHGSEGQSYCFFVCDRCGKEKWIKKEVEE